nr:glycosyltransferase family 2 protein [Nakamurella lactea]
MTVVVPVYNDAVMLRECLAALERQTRPPDTILVVDNGSTDDSAVVATAGGAKVIHQPVRGILSATAHGFDHAEGDVLARIDADSRPESDWLERVVGRFEGDPRLAAVTGSGRFYGGNAVTRFLGRHLYLGGYFLWLRLLLGHPPLYGSNFAIRSDVWRSISGGVHRSYRWIHDDLDISFRLGPQTPVYYDRQLPMPVSARPFASFAATGRRVGWGFRTIWINAREQNLLARRRRIVRSNRSA